MGLLPVIFREFVTELLPLIDIRFSFPLNILRKKGWNFTKSYRQDPSWDCYLSFNTKGLLHGMGNLHGSLPTLGF